jgi:hypothetical protein
MYFFSLPPTLNVNSLFSFFFKENNNNKKKDENRTSFEPNRHPTGILAASRRALIQQSPSILFVFLLPFFIITTQHLDLM